MSFAARAAAAGRSVQVIEAQPRLGGCLHSERLESGYWFEMGAHTCYNSYGGLLRIVEEVGLAGEILARHKVPFRLLRDGELLSIPGALSFWELFVNSPRMFTANKAEQTVAEYYSRLVGKGNYRDVLGPMLSAVPSQDADGFPATMLFKKRPRRKDIVRSFTMTGGLQSIPDAVAALDNVEVSTGDAVQNVERIDGGFAVVTEAGERHEAPALALATPPDVAARLVDGILPELAASLGRIGMARVETVGVVAPSAAVPVEPVAGIIPTEDLFRSVVTRDTVPDPEHRGFAFHFRPDQPEDQRLQRISEVLSIPRGDLDVVAHKDMTLPSPAMGHEQIVAELDERLAGTGIYLTGNYFDGLAIEECVARSEAEFARFEQASG
jgi:UDP-galactopyranose mutase